MIYKRNPIIEKILPPLSAEDYQRLKNDIKERGIDYPIIIDSETNEIIDGWNRYQIARELKKEVPVAKKTFKDPVAAGISLNLARRQLTLEQKLEISQRLAELGYSQKERAKLIGISRSRLSEIENISNVDSDNIYIPDLRYKLTEEQEKEIVQKAKMGIVQSQIAADYGISQPRVTQIIHEYEKLEKEESLKPQPIKGKYRTLVIDPPWPIEKIRREVRPKQLKVDYQTLSVEEIKNFKEIKNAIDRRGCHVYLWTTHKHLPDALDCLKAWEVKYECVLTWIKNVGFTPFSWMYSTELILFGRVGNLDLLKKGIRLDFFAKVREHSRKPDEFYEIVKKVSPEPRIDFFSREKRRGFDQYGKEINKF